MTKLEWMAGMALATLMSLSSPTAAQDNPVAKGDKKPTAPTAPAKRPAAPTGKEAARVAAPRAAAVTGKALTPDVATAPAKTVALAPPPPLQPTAPLATAGETAVTEPLAPSQPAAPRPPDANDAAKLPAAGEAVAPSPSERATRWSGDELTKSLTGYGHWLLDPSYGEVWIPDAKHVGEAFAPYLSGGRWKVADGAWSFASDYPFGDTVFHYGNWVWLRDKWAWVPGRSFAPAWVVWRLGEPGYDYVGWAPLPPAKLTVEAPPGSVAQGSLPFWFAPTRRLFGKHLEDNIVTDRALGQELLGHSRIFEGNRAEGASSFAPASPTLRDARIRALRKVLVTTAGSKGARQFATPPDPKPAAPTAQRSQFRCHLVSTRPRAWRCGHE